MISRTVANGLLESGVKLNPGPWREHSISVAENARLIAERVLGMDPEMAYVMGLLHDIGRREGVFGIRHIFDGYKYMMSLGEPDVARICLTHSFPLKNTSTFFGRYDATREDMEFLECFLNEREYDDYDRLIQLCDAISLPEGACILEKRFVDVALRHGLPPCTIDKWKAFMELKSYFDTLTGENIYSLLPDVFENSSRNLL